MMKYWLAFVFGLVLSLPPVAAETAGVRLYCTSVRLLPATGGTKQANTLKISTDPSFAQINNELSPLFDPQVYFRIEGPGAVGGQFALNLPELGDANGNGFEDFYEVGQMVNEATSDGFYSTSANGGSLTAVWNREAGSATGTCRLTVDNYGTFTNKFELIVYSGTLSYQPETAGITGSLALTRTQFPTSTLTGAVILRRVSTNPFDQLTLSAGTLTDATGKTLSYQSALVDRDTGLKTNYFGTLTFNDGDLSTTVADYRQWVLSIDDANDANRNGIPDLSDEPPAAPPQSPKLELVRAADKLLLTIRSAQSGTYDLEGVQSLGSATWLKAASITVTNDPQSVPLPDPVARTMFWRLRAR